MHTPETTVRAIAEECPTREQLEADLPPVSERTQRHRLFPAATHDERFVAASERIATALEAIASAFAAIAEATVADLDGQPPEAPKERYRTLDSEPIPERMGGAGR